ncbi:hypothetical protein MASR1M12_27360 [Erysipelotrichia bacterium]
MRSYSVTRKILIFFISVWEDGFVLLSAEAESAEELNSMLEISD